MRKLILISFILFSSSLFSQDRTYELIWADEFEGENLNLEKWNFETGGNGWGNQELQFYTNRPENVFIRDGKLVIKALLEEYGIRNFTSARINTQGKMPVKYGKIEARIKLPKGKGTWPAFWMMPEKSVYGAWPRSGEIDIMEHIGSNPNMISYAMHTQSKNGSAGNNWHNTIYPGNVEGEFNVYAIEWLEDRVAFYFNDQKQVTYWNDLTNNYKTWPFDQEFFVILNLAIGGKMGGSVDVNIFNSDVEMEVDYVRIYQEAGSGIGENPNDLLQVYGDRASNKIKIKGLSSMANIKVTDVNGRERIQLNSSDSDIEINNPALDQGLFLVSIIQDGVANVYKVIL